MSNKIIAFMSDGGWEGGGGCRSEVGDLCLNNFGPLAYIIVLY